MSGRQRQTLESCSLQAVMGDGELCSSLWGRAAAAMLSATCLKIHPVLTDVGGMCCTFIPALIFTLTAVLSEPKMGPGAAEPPVKVKGRPGRNPSMGLKFCS